MSKKLLKLDLPLLVDAGMRAHQQIIETKNEPWTTHYKKAFDIEMSGWVTVVTRVDQSRPGGNVCVLKTFSGRDAKKKVSMLRRIVHLNFLTPSQIFEDKEPPYFHVISEYMHVSLFQIYCSAVYPDENQLAGILGQASSSSAVISKGC